MNNAVEQFIISCLRARWDAKALEEAHGLGASIDWHDFSSVAIDGQLAPLLYLIVRGRGIVPGSLEESFSYSYYYCGARNAVVLHKLKSVLAALAKENIPTLLLKGAALVDRVYQNAAIRPMGDIDLLVPRQHLERAVRALGPSYQVPECIGTYAGANLAIEQGAAAESRKNSRVALDLNCYLVESPYFSHMRFVKWLWETAAPGEMAGSGVFELSREALVLHLCAHLLMEQKGKQLLWLHDIAEVLALYREQLRWDVLLENAQRFDLALALEQVLARLERDWRLVLPERWKQSLSDLQTSTTERRFYAWFASRDQSVPTLFSLNADGPQKALTLGYLWDNLVPQPAYMSERYRVGSRWLVPLAYPYRWYRGMRSAMLDSLPRRLRRTLAAGQV